MKKKLYSKRFLQGALSLLAASLVVGCNVDDSYDLSNIDTDNIGIGSTTSKLDIPLATIHLGLSSLGNESGGSLVAASRVSPTPSLSSFSATEMMELLKTVDALLPSDLSGTEYEGGIDISKLSGSDAADENYTQGLVDILIDEVKNDETKRTDLCEILIDNNNDSENHDYADVIDSFKDDLKITIAPTMSKEELSAQLGTELNKPENESKIKNLSTTMTEVVKTQSSGIKTDYEVTEDLDDVSLGEDVLDILKGNLDGKSNYLYVVASLSHNIPMSVEITPSIILVDPETNESTTIEIKDRSLIDDESAHTKLTDEQVDMLVNGLGIKADIHINFYDPSAGTLDIDDKEVEVTLVARKGGSISL